MTSDQIEWGSWSDERPELLRTLQPRQVGQRLFVLRNGAVELPKRPLMIMPFSGITAWGYVNVTPVHLRCELDSTMSSQDGVQLCCVFDLELSAKSDTASLADIVENHRALDRTVMLTVTNAVRRAVARQPYSKLFFSDVAAHGQVEAALEEALENRTPYLLRGCSFEVAALEPGFDERLTAARGVVVQVSESAEYAEVQDGVRKRRRQHQAEDVDHEIKIGGKRAGAQRKEREEDSEATRRVAKRRQEDEAAALKELKKLFEGDNESYLALKYPKLYVDLRTMDAQDRIETARVMQAFQVEMGVGAGRWDGFGEAMRRLHLIMNNSSFDMKKRRGDPSSDDDPVDATPSPGGPASPDAADAPPTAPAEEG